MATPKLPTRKKALTILMEFDMNNQQQASKKEHSFGSSVRLWIREKSGCFYQVILILWCL